MFYKGDLCIPRFGYPALETNPMRVPRDNCIYIPSLPERVRRWTVHFSHLFGHGTSSCPTSCQCRGFASTGRELSCGSRCSTLWRRFWKQLNFIPDILEGFLIRVSKAPVAFAWSQCNSEKRPTFTLQRAPFEGKNYVVTLAIVHCRAQPLGLLEPKGQLLLGLLLLLPITQSDVTLWLTTCSLTTFDICQWVPHSFPFIQPPYSAWWIASPSQKRFCKRGWQKISAPKTRRPFVLGVLSWRVPSVVAFLDRLSSWTFGLCVCWSTAELFVCAILSPSSLVSSYSCCWNSHLPAFRCSEGIHVRKYHETILI